jgi:hypothetical protein
VDHIPRDRASLEGHVMLDPQAAISRTKDLFQHWSHERERLDHIDHWYRWHQEPIQIPRVSTSELRRLAKLAKVPWLSLVVTTVAQSMYVDGFRSKLDDPSDDDIDPRSPWQIWLANGFDQRQMAVHRAALAYGYSFVSVMPGVNFMGESEPVMRGISPRKMVALWDDPASDDWPQIALKVEKSGGEYLCKLYDDTAIYELVGDNTGSSFTYVGEQVHDTGIVPIVRYCNELDLDGRTPGEVEPHIDLARKINKTAYDRLVTQHFSSWKVRTIAGLAEPDDDEVKTRKKLQLAQDDILVAEDPDTKFGTLDETPLSGFIDAWRSDIEALAAVSQTPTHELTGQLANLSAEALAAARAALTQKVTERQKSFGRSHAQALRLAALINGDDDYARDVTGRVTWQDMEIRSISQAVDALGKAAQMLGIPVKALWGRIPGVERSDVEEWAKMAMDGDPIMQMRWEMEAQAKAQAVNPNQGQDANPDQQQFAPSTGGKNV